jgi:NADH-quinone oxidoreductase subunit L
VVGTPAWPAFETYLSGHHAEFNFGKLLAGGTLSLMATSAVIVFAGLGLGWWLYGRRQRKTANEPDVLEVARPDIFALLRNKYFFDEAYEKTVIAFNAWFARACDFMDRWVWGGAVMVVSAVMVGLAWLYRATDEFVVNLGFDAGCDSIRRGGGGLSKLHTGRVQTYLRVIGVALVVLIIFLVWGRKA